MKKTVIKEGSVAMRLADLLSTSNNELLRAGAVGDPVEKIMVAVNHNTGLGLLWKLVSAEDSDEAVKRAAARNMMRELGRGTVHLHEGSMVYELRILKDFADPGTKISLRLVIDALEQMEHEVTRMRRENVWKAA